jgi:Mg2+/Co2+ transporter CorB
LIIEHLEFIPEATCCLQVGGYRVEILQIKDNMIRAARVIAPETELRDDEDDPPKE